MPKITDELFGRIEAEIARLKLIAEKHYGRTFEMPSIEFNVRGTRAGEAEGTWRLGLNPVLLLENEASFFKDTIPHEFAHNIDSALGRNDNVGLIRTRTGRIRRAKRSVHGPSWKAIMVLFGADPDGRTHEYDVTNAQVKVKRKYEYRCENCSAQVFVSSVRHNKMQRGTVYWHKGCGSVRGRLLFVQSLGQRTFNEARALSEQRSLKVAEAPRPEPSFTMLKPQPEPQGNMAIAKSIMVKYGYNLTRQQFIVRAVEAGLKATTASTYYNQLRKKS